MDGQMIGRYEDSDYATKRYNESGETYHFRYDYEYKAFYNKPSNFKREK